MSASEVAPGVPAWVEQLAMPVWVSTSSGTVTHLNADAARLVGHPRESCVGHPCYLVISGRTLKGAPLCGPKCRVRALAAGFKSIPPFPIRIPIAAGGYREATVVVIAAGRDQLVHCVVDTAHHQRLRGFIDHIVRRAAAGTGCRLHGAVLTSREREILALLSADLTQQEIADRLVVSYATVRNHVQHILAKLGVHSILEAVAFYLSEEG